MQKDLPSPDLKAAPRAPLRASELRELTFPGYKSNLVPPLHDPRSTRLPWAKSTGSHATRLEKARYYLRSFEYESVAEHALDTDIFVSVVCNLRNYYRLTREETIKLMAEVFNPISWEVWSSDAVTTAWELVEGFTPTLGASDPKTEAMRRAALIENEVVDLIAWTLPGGRVRCSDLLIVFNAWNPEIAASKRELGVAVKAITGLASTSINGVRYWNGFHIPTSEEDAMRDSIEAVA